MLGRGESGEGRTTHTAAPGEVHRYSTQLYRVRVYGGIACGTFGFAGRDCDVLCSMADLRNKKTKAISAKLGSQIHSSATRVHASFSEGEESNDDER